MILPRIGLFHNGGQLTVVMLTARGRKLEHFVAQESAEPTSALESSLQSQGLWAPRIRIGLDRGLVLVKVLDLPRAAVDNIAQMVGFELERHVPFAPEESRFDWTELPVGPDEPRRVLVVACERRTVERSLALLGGSRHRLAAVTVACHALPALLSRGSCVGRTIWAHRHDGGTDLLFLQGRTPLLSRRVAPEGVLDLAREIERSLPLVRWSRCDHVWLSGDDAPTWLAAPDLPASLEAPVSAPPYAAGHAARIAALPVEAPGAHQLALAVATTSDVPLNLLPSEMRPHTLTRTQVATAAMIAATLGLGMSLAFTHVHNHERYVARLNDEIRRLEPETKTVEGLGAELARKKRLVTALRSLQDKRIHPLPVLQELTETVPAGAWLQYLSMDREGVELSGQADAANQLIPLLEATRWLERVEFTSPVTKAQGKEQFRIRASWEPPRPSAPGPGR